MPEFIKKNWGFFLLGLALLVLLIFSLSKQPKHVLPAVPQTTKPGETPTQTTPSADKRQLPASVNDERVVTEDKDQKTESNSAQDGESDEPVDQNYVLCEHIISGETQYEFTGEIRLINKGTKPVYGWSVHWEYEDGSTIIDASNVALGGNNPYTGEYLSWNAEIPPGKTVTFSFTGIKNGDSAPKRVDVKGKLCM